MPLAAGIGNFESVELDPSAFIKETVMAEFMGDFVVLLAMGVLASGLWLLDVTKRDSRGLSAKLGAWVLILAGFGAGVCASSYMWTFRSAGDFDRAYPPMLLQHDMKMMGAMAPVRPAPGFSGYSFPS
jgi:hypothetical protein